MKGFLCFVISAFPLVVQAQTVAADKTSIAAPADADVRQMIDFKDREAEQRLSQMQVYLEMLIAASQRNSNLERTVVVEQRTKNLQAQLRQVNKEQLAMQEHRVAVLEKELSSMAQRKAESAYERLREEVARRKEALVKLRDLLGQ